MKRSRKAKGDSPATKSPKRRQRRPDGGVKTRSHRAAGPITARLKKILAVFPHPELARICGVARQAVHQWRDLPPQHALAVEKASDGKFSREWLAPSFYPRPAT